MAPWRLHDNDRSRAVQPEWDFSRFIDSGIRIDIAYGSDLPAHKKKFQKHVEWCWIALFWFYYRNILSRSPSFSDLRIDSLASIQNLFPLIVFISPLCPSTLKGLSKVQLGKVLVLNLEWTRAMALWSLSSLRSPKYSTELVWGKHSLINKHFCWKARNIKELFLPYFWVPYNLFGTFPYYEQLAFKIILPYISAQEYLPYVWFGAACNPPIVELSRGTSRNPRKSTPSSWMILRNISVHFFSIIKIFRKENESCSKLAFRRKCISLDKIEIPGDLDHHSGGHRLFCCRAFQLRGGSCFWECQGHCYYWMRFPPFHMGHKADSQLPCFKFLSV